MIMQRFIWMLVMTKAPGDHLDHGQDPSYHDGDEDGDDKDEAAAACLESDGGRWVSKILNPPFLHQSTSSTNPT